MPLIKLLVVLFSLYSSFLAAEKSPYTYTIPVQKADGWRTANLLSEITDVSLIEKMFNQLQAGEHKIDSTVLVKDGRIVLEKYFAGNNADQQHDLRSVTKSIRALLVVIAIDRGFIDDINDPILKYLNTHQIKKNKHKSKHQITLKHLMTMSSGLDCNDWDKKSKGQEDRVYKKRDWLQYTLDLPVINEPGEVAFYCSMGAILAAEVVSQASGMKIDEFAEKYLFKPLNISNYSWSHTAKRKEVLPSAKRLYMTTRDLAKIGQLVLQNGQWQGQQIVASAWIEQITTKQVDLAGLGYGLFWWNIPFQVNEQSYMAIVATGNGGQYIFVFPTLNLVAVFTGSAYNSDQDKLPFAAIKDIYLPTFQLRSRESD